jgi:hypothetical protein
MFAIIGRFVGREFRERLGDGFDEVFGGSRGGLSQRCFELGERLFDRIEAAAIGRRIARCRAGSLNRFPDAGGFVGRQIVHHGDIALVLDRRERMFDIGQETRTIHWPIENARCMAGLALIPPMRC